VAMNNAFECEDGWMAFYVRKEVVEIAYSGRCHHISLEIGTDLEILFPIEFTERSIHAGVSIQAFLAIEGRAILTISELNRWNVKGVEKLGIHLADIPCSFLGQLSAVIGNFYVDIIINVASGLSTRVLDYEYIASFGLVFGFRKGYDRV